MPANLPPQFFELSAKLKEVETPEEKITILKEMLAICPKHKGTEKVQRDLKTKIAKLKKEAKIKRKEKREELYFVKKEGAGQIVVVGPPNSGKTSLVNALTGTSFRVGDFPFTTSLPQPAMMKYEDILIQLVDTPPLTKDFQPGWLRNILKNCDGILAVFDVDQFKENFCEFNEILKKWDIKKKMILILNKIDLLENLKNFDEFLKVSVKNTFGLEELKKRIFEMLEIVRIYTKKPAREPDLEKPFILKKGSQLSDLIEEINPGIISNFKYAKLFKFGIKKPIIVGKDYIFEDKDIIEIHF